MTCNIPDCSPLSVDKVWSTRGGWCLTKSVM